MKRKIYISLLTLLFFVSTTALPLTMHLCKMNSESEMCAMCSNEVEAKSCCEETIDDSEIISQANNPCCEIKVVDPSVKDNFISINLEIKKEKSSTFVYLTDLISKQLSLNHKFINSDAYHPPAQHNDLYLQNSVLLI